MLSRISKASSNSLNGFSRCSSPANLDLKRLLLNVLMLNLMFADKYSNNSFLLVNGDPSDLTK